MVDVHGPAEKVVPRGAEADAPASVCPNGSLPLSVAIGLVALCAGLGLFATSIFLSLPSNVVMDRGTQNNMRQFSITWVPQGWGFFTRPPSENGIRVFAPDSLEPLLHTPQNAASNLWGLSRTQRAQGPEVANLVLEVEVAEWFSCELGSTLADCRDALAWSGTPPREVTNTSPLTTICGPALIVESKPVSWSYRHLYEEVFTPVASSGWM